MGNRLARGLASSLCDEGTTSTSMELEFCQVLNTGREADIAELGVGSKGNSLAAYS